jgi:hypothetical protein
MISVNVGRISIKNITESTRTERNNRSLPIPQSPKRRAKKFFKAGGTYFDT